MGPGAATMSCLSKYATFSGRAGRAEYWWFFGSAIASSGLLAGLDRIAMRDAAIRERVEAAFSVLIFLPLVAAGFRRLHDTGRAGWLMLVAVAASAAGKLLIEGGILGARFFAPPIHGALPTGAVATCTGVPIILVLYWLLLPSQPGPNQYGPNPHEVTS